MENIYFEYGGVSYSGYILNEAADEPRYFWLVFDENEMIELLGETVAFHVTSEGLLPVYEHSTRASLVDYLRTKVEAALVTKGLIRETAQSKKAK